MFCKKCGAETELSDKFCKACGEPIGLVSEEGIPVVLEPPKDLVWNVEGFPKDSKEVKTPDLSIEWGKDSLGNELGRDFVVDDFYVDEAKNIAAQQKLDEEIEKINNENGGRNAAVSRMEPEPSTETLEEMATDDVREPEPEPSMEPEPEPELVPEPESELAPEPEPEPEPEIIPVPEPAPVPVPPPAINRYEQIFMEEEEEEKRKFSFGKLLLGILLLVIIAEAAFLGFRYYMPDNPTVKLINNQMTQAAESVQKWFTPVIPEEEEPLVEDPVEEEPLVTEPVEEEPQIEEAVPLIPENPYPDNKNIGEILMNPDIKFISGRNYGIADINNSLPATENTDDVINTIIAYDSKWIDYVNNGDKGVLDYTAPQSQAQLNTLSFTKVGKIKETFISLEIGEIRKGAKGYYVWTREKIQIEENGAVTTKTFAWIYQVAPYNNEMKIVNYFSYK